MSNTYGNKFRFTIFGQSHSSAIGVVMEGIPAGEEIDFEKLQAFLDTRAPGRNKYSTQRKEDDMPQFTGGIKDGKTCGTPVSALIFNKDQRSKDYSQIAETPRPGHADYPAAVKYGGFQDYAGGGHFSGRMTAPLCIAGGIALQLLEKEGIKINAEILSIAGEKTEEKMYEAIEKAKAKGDSVGGVIECTITGLPVGLGSHMFSGMENRISQAVFGIPAIKGIEFGDGFALAGMYGSQSNDPFILEDGMIKTATNHMGGILGGMTTGMPLVFRVAVKPTPSIGVEQDTVNLKTMEPAKIVVNGRHDPCIVPRAVPCVTAAAAAAVYDAILEG